MKKIILIFCICASVLGCISSKEVAETTADEFVKGNVRFFSSNNDQQEPVVEYEREITDSFREGKIWNVIMHVSADIGNETKEAVVKVKVEDGKVVSFEQVSKGS